MDKGSKKVRENEKRAKVILTELEKGPVRRVELLKRVIHACGTPARFNSTFDWLKEKGRIEKCGPGHMDPYKITWSGKQFLAGLVAEGEK